MNQLEIARQEVFQQEGKVTRQQMGTSLLHAYIEELALGEPPLGFAAHRLYNPDFFTLEENDGNQNKFFIPPEKIPAFFNILEEDPERLAFDCASVLPVMNMLVLLRLMENDGLSMEEFAAGVDGILVHGSFSYLQVNGQRFNLVTPVNEAKNRYGPVDSFIEGIPTKAGANISEAADFREIAESLVIQGAVKPGDMFHVHTAGVTNRGNADDQNGYVLRSPYNPFWRNRYFSAKDIHVYSHRLKLEGRRETIAEIFDRIGNRIEAHHNLSIDEFVSQGGFRIGFNRFRFDTACETIYHHLR